MKKILGPIISILIAEGVGLLSSFLTLDSMSNAYQNLILPSFAPPSWLFGPVWILLYALMGLAAYRVWKLKGENIGVNSALILYGVQLFFNFLWTIIFFGWQLRGLALLEIMILLILIIITTIKFFKIDKIAGILMMPYLLWVAFAGVLNYAIWILNR